MRIVRMTMSCLVILLCACGERNVHDGESPYEPAEPVYAAAKSLKGVYRSGFETSAIHLCETSREECLTSIGPDDGCWVEFTEAAYRQLVELRGDGDKGDAYEETWLEGRGRVTRKPGGFGHMSAHACQVELTTVQAIDPGPPWAFQPPPP